MSETMEVVTMEEESWKPEIEELFAVCTAILFLVGAFVYAGVLFVGMVIAAFTMIFIVFVLYAFLAYGPVQKETDNRLMKPVGLTGTLFLVFYIVNTFFLNLTSYWREIFVYIFTSIILALLLAQLAYIYLLKDRKVGVLPQKFESREQLLYAIMYVAAFLVVFVTLFGGEANYDNFLGVAIYCLATTLIFQFLILEYVPIEKINNFIFVIGIATVLGIIAASRSINILLILASVGGVVGATKLYQVLRKRSVSAEASK
jgi:hypothetical protein